jgi:hypothetical protein
MMIERYPEGEVDAQAKSGVVEAATSSEPLDPALDDAR